jgi:hypothetical protein
VVLQLEHTWSVAEGCTNYVSVLDVGARAWAMAPVNRVIAARVFPDPLLRAWIVHNVEEVGLLEHILPPLYAEQAAPVAAAR